MTGDRDRGVRPGEAGGTKGRGARGADFAPGAGREALVSAYQRPCQPCWLLTADCPEALSVGSRYVPRASLPILDSWSHVRGCSWRFFYVVTLRSHFF